MVRVRGKRIEVGRGGYGTADATMWTDTRELADLLGNGSRLDRAIKGGRTRVDGDRAALHRLLDAITIPDPAPVESRR